MQNTSIHHMLMKGRLPITVHKAGGTEVVPLESQAALASKPHKDPATAALASSWDKDSIGILGKKQFLVSWSFESHRLILMIKAHCGNLPDIIGNSRTSLCTCPNLLSPEEHLHSKMRPQSPEVYAYRFVFLFIFYRWMAWYISWLFLYSCFSQFEFTISVQLLWWL